MAALEGRAKSLPSYPPPAPSHRLPDNSLCPLYVFVVLSQLIVKMGTMEHTFRLSPLEGLHFFALCCVT